MFIRCISVNLVVGQRLDSRCSTANWWERSPNCNNSNNFCNVNTNGNANNNNARNSNGLAPDPETWRNKTFTKGEVLPVTKVQNSPPMLPHGRHRVIECAWRGIVSYLVSCVVGQSRLDDTQQDICTEGEQNLL